MIRTKWPNPSGKNFPRRTVKFAVRAINTVRKVGNRKSKHLKGRFGPRVGDGNVFAPKEVCWDPVLVTVTFLH